MIVGGDRAIEMPVKDLYNTLLMLASINAAKDIYDYGLKRMDDFLKTYGDFYSPIAKDVDYWYNNTTKKVGDVIDYLYRNGIDPTRSAEGRAMILRTIREAPVGELAKIKLSAENAKTYQKNYAALLAAGKLNPKVEAWLMRDANGNPRSLAQWDTAKDGVFDRLSPALELSIYDLVNPLVKDMKPTYDDELTKKMNDGNRYYTISPDKVKTTINMALPSIKDSPYGSYYYQLFLDLYGGDKEKANKAMSDALYSLNGVSGTYKVDPDDFAMERVKFSDDMAKIAKLHEYSVAEEKLKSQLRKDELYYEKSISGDNSTNTGNTVFDDLDSIFSSGSGESKEQGYDPGDENNRVQIDGVYSAPDILNPSQMNLTTKGAFSWDGNHWQRIPDGTVLYAGHFAKKLRRDVNKNNTSAKVHYLFKYYSADGTLYWIPGHKGTAAKGSSRKNNLNVNVSVPKNNK